MLAKETIKRVCDAEKDADNIELSAKKTALEIKEKANLKAIEIAEAAKETAKNIATEKLKQAEDTAKIVRVGLLDGTKKDIEKLEAITKSKKNDAIKKIVDELI
ncbi:MAG: hypothetical protein RSC29_00970 [Oscillospiraceae bacterium]